MDQVVLYFLVCFAMVCVFATFGVMMPVVGQTVSTLFIVVMGERALARLQGRRSDSDIDE